MPEYHSAVTAFVDQAMTTTEIQIAQDCAQRLVDACPLTPIETWQDAADRRAAFDELKATIANTEDRAQAVQEPAAPDRCVLPRAHGLRSAGAAAPCGGRRPPAR